MEYRPGLEYWVIKLLKAKFKIVAYLIFLTSLEGIAVSFLGMIKNKLSLSIIEDLSAKGRKIRWIKQKVCVQLYSLGKWMIWNMRQFNLKLLGICLADKFDINLMKIICSFNF